MPENSRNFWHFIRHLIIELIMSRREEISLGVAWSCPLSDIPEILYHARANMLSHRKALNRAGHLMMLRLACLCVEALAANAAALYDKQLSEAVSLMMGWNLTFTLSLNSYQ